MSTTVNLKPTYHSWLTFHPMPSGKKPLHWVWFLIQSILCLGLFIISILFLIDSIFYIIDVLKLSEDVNHKIFGDNLLIAQIIFIVLSISMGIYEIVMKSFGKRILSNYAPNVYAIRMMIFLFPSVFLIAMQLIMSKVSPHDYKIGGIVEVVTAIFASVLICLTTAECIKSFVHRKSVYAAHSRHTGYTATVN